MSHEYCVIYITVGNPDEARRIADTLVEEKIAACCNIVPGIHSVYRWKGKICRDAETLLILKTRRASFEKLRARAKELHSYEVPEIIALPILEGHTPYMDWLRDETE